LQDTFTPWSQQWNLNIQRQLPWQMNLEVAYVGTRGLQLSRNGEGGLSLNQARSAVSFARFGFESVGAESVLSAWARSAFSRRRRRRAPSCCGHTRNSPTSRRCIRAALRPITTRCKSASAKRLSQGMQIDGNYTWAKNIEEGLTHQDSYNIRGDRGLASIDIAHRFVISYLLRTALRQGRQVR
jgi:hypothetical protein